MPNHESNAVFLFSWTRLWSMTKGSGAPSYHHTVDFYYRSPDWDLYIFTTDETNLALGSDRVYVYKTAPWLEKLCKKREMGLPFRWLKYYLYSGWARKKAADIYRNAAPARCVSYGYETWTIKAARGFAHKLGIPLITRFQGTVLTFKRDRIWDRIIMHPAYDNLETKADLVIMTDDGSDGERTLQRLGNHSKCLFIRNGLDLYDRHKDILEKTDKTETRRELGLTPDDFVCMTAARLVGWKRTDRSLRAVAAARKEIPGIRLVIAGDGAERGRLEELARELKIGDIVRFLGAVQHSDLCRYMVAADVFLSTNDLSNLGNPLFEAMMLGKAVVTLNNGETKTVVRDGYNGLLVEPDCTEELSERLVRLYRNPEERETLSKNALAYAEKTFYSWETRMKTEEAAVLEVLRQSESPDKR